MLVNFAQSTSAYVPDMVPIESCYVGWQESLRKLAKPMKSISEQFGKRLRNLPTHLLPIHSL